MKRRLNSLALLGFILSSSFFLGFFSFMTYGLLVNSSEPGFPLWMRIALYILFSYLMAIFLVFEPYKSLRYKDQYINDDHQFNYREMNKVTIALEKDVKEKFECGRVFIQYTGMYENGAKFTASFNAGDPTRISEMQDYISNSLEKQLFDEMKCDVTEITFMVTFNERIVFD